MNYKLFRELWGIRRIMRYTNIYIYVYKTQQWDRDEGIGETERLQGRELQRIWVSMILRNLSTPSRGNVGCF